MQVWSNNKKLVFQRVRPSPIKSWNLIGNYFVFEEDLKNVKVRMPAKDEQASYMIVEIGKDEKQKDDQDQESIRELRVKVINDT